MNCNIYKKVLSIKPDPDYISKPNFKFATEFFRKHFKSEKLSIQIESKLDGRHSLETFKTWETKVVKQLKKSGVNYFSNGKMEEFNKQHETYVQERVDVKNSLIAGLGAFAKKTFERGDFIGFYAGHYKKALETVPINEQSYYFDLPEEYGGEYVISGAPGDGGNALCRANDVTTHGQFPVKLEPGLKLNKVNIVSISVVVNGIPFIGYFAKRDVSEGDELFISYGKSYWQNLKENQDVEYVECHITKIIPAGFEEIFNVDSGQIELGEISSNDIERDSKRRRIDKSAQQVIWIDLEGSDDLSGESETDDGLAGSSSTHKSLYDRYKVEGINIDLTTFLKRLNSQIKSFIDLYELPVVEMLDLKQNSFITQDMQQAFFTCIATHTFFKEATYLYEDEIETKTSQLERVCDDYEESKIGTENAGVTCWANASLVFLRGVQLYGKSLPEYLESIILSDEEVGDTVSVDGYLNFELNNEDRYREYRRETINQWRHLLSHRNQDPGVRKGYLLEIIEKFNRIIQPIPRLAANVQNDPTEFIQQAFIYAFIPESDQFVDSDTRKIRDELKGAIAMFGGDVMTTTRTGLNANGERYEISKPKEVIVWLGLSPRNLEQGDLNRTIKRQEDGDIEPQNPEAGQIFQAVGQVETIEFRSDTIYAKRTHAEYDRKTKILTTKKIDTPMPIPVGKEATDLKRAIIHWGGSMNGGHYISVVKASDGNYYEINDARQRKINDIGTYWDQNKGNILLTDFGDSPVIEVPVSVEGTGAAGAAVSAKPAILKKGEKRKHKSCNDPNAKRLKANHIKKLPEYIKFFLKSQRKKIEKVRGSSGLIEFLFSEIQSGEKKYLDLLVEKNFTKADIVKMIGNNGAKQAMEWLFTKLDGKSHLEHLLAKEFTKADIVTMIGNIGAKQAMEWLFTMSGAKTYLDHLLENTFTKADIVKMIGNNGAKQVMEWLFTKLDGKSHLDHLLANEFSKDDIVKMIGNDGAKQGMVWLFTDFEGKPYLDHLLAKNFTKADIVKMIGNIGAKQVMEWLFTKDGEKSYLDHLLVEKNFTKDNIVKMIGNGGAKQVMEWLFTMSGEKIYLDHLLEKTFIKDDIVKMIGNGGAKQVMEWLFTMSGEKIYLDHLLEKTFVKDDIVKMIGNDGAKQAMEWLFTTSGEKSYLDHLLDKEFTKEDIVKMIGKGGAKQAMEWLFAMSGEKPYLDHLLDKNFTKEDIVKMIGNGGAKQAMEWLFTTSGEKSYLDHLLAKNFTKDDIVKMLGNGGAKQAMEWLFTKDGEKPYLDHLLDKNFTKDDIIKMIGNNGAKQAMEWLFAMSGEKPYLDHLLDKNFTKEDIVKMTGNAGAKQSMEWLFTMSGAKTYLDHLLENTFTKADIVKMIGKGGAKQAMTWLFTKLDRKSHLDHLLANEFSKDDIVKMIGNDGAKQAMVWLFTDFEGKPYLDHLLAKNFTKADIVKMIGNIGAKQVLTWLFTDFKGKSHLDHLLEKKFSIEHIQKMVSRKGSKGRLEILFPMIDKLLKKYRLSHDAIGVLSRKDNKKFKIELAKYL